MNSSSSGDIMQNLDELENSIVSYQDLQKFIGVLLDAYENGYIENQSIDEYLSGLQGILKGLPSWQQNVFPDEPFPDQPDWRWLGRILYAAFHHS